MRTHRLQKRCIKASAALSPTDGTRPIS